MLMEVLEAVIGLPEQDRQRLESAVRPPLADLEQDRLRAIDGHFGIIRLLVPDRGNLSGGADEVAEHGLALDDASVVLGVNRGRHGVHERGQVRRTADGIEPITASELVAQGHEVDRLALAVEGEHGFVDIAVLGSVEVSGLQEVADPENGVRVDQNRAEHALLSLDGLRCQLVDAHESGSRTDGGRRAGCARGARPHRDSRLNPLIHAGGDKPRPNVDGLWTLPVCGVPPDYR